MKRKHSLYGEGVRLRNYCISLNPNIVEQFDLLLKEINRMQGSNMNRSEGVRKLMDKYIKDNNGSQNVDK